jgi:hypothetical protein
VAMYWVSDVSMESAAPTSRAEVSRGRTCLDCVGRPCVTHGVKELVHSLDQ